MHSLRTFWHMLFRMPLRDGMEIEINGRRLTAQQKDERQQDNSDKKRLVHHHPSDLLHSLTREWIGRGQHGVVSPALRALPFRTSMCSAWGTWCACVYLVSCSASQWRWSWQLTFMYEELHLQEHMNPIWKKCLCGTFVDTTVQKYLSNTMVWSTRYACLAFDRCCRLVNVLHLDALGIEFGN